MTTSATPILELRDLRKHFGSTVAVDGVSERFARGEYVCILGPSGCGKTTLLRLVAGFEAPDGGEVLLDGGSLAGVPPERRDLHIVFQSYALFPHMSVEENVAFGLRMKRVPGPELRRRTLEALELVRLADERGRLPRQLSGGQQQRVALARALVNRPKLLLLDEPLSALDKNLRLAMQEELRTLQRETGITFLHITHDQGEALALADRVAVMAAGRFAQVGAPQHVYERPASRFVAEFLGASNVLAATRSPRREGHVVIAPGVELAVAEQAVADGSETAAAPAHAPPGVPADAPPSVGAPVALSIRPERIALNRDAPAAGVNVLRGRVRRVSFHGALVECLVETAAGALVVHHAGRLAAGALREGEELWVRVAPEDVVVLPAEDAAPPGTVAPPAIMEPPEAAAPPETAAPPAAAGAGGGARG